MINQDNSRARILIVDDDDRARDIVRVFLHRESCDLHFASGGQEALDTVPTLQPDVILLDVMMPDMSGFDVCRILKADKDWQCIPIILITALDRTEDLVQGIDAGADEFLIKPVNAAELRACVHSMLRIKRQHDELRKALELQERLTDLVVQETRDPLTTIAVSCELLKDSLYAASDLAEIEHIQTAVARLNVHVDAVLIMTKIREGRMVLTPSPVDVRQFMLAARERHDVVARARGLELVVDPLVKSQMISLDLDLFQRVFDNLISVALKRASFGGTVVLRIEYPPAAETASCPYLIRFQIVDCGALGQGVVDSCFRELDSASWLQPDAAHLGVELTFCTMVAEAHGGRITVSRDDAGGFAYSIEL